MLPRTAESSKGYSNPDNDPRGVWASLPLQARSGTDPNFTHVFSNGISWTPPPGRYSAFSHDSLDEMEKDNRIWFGATGKNIPRYKKFLSEVKDGLVPTTIWFRDEVGDNQEAKTEVKLLNEDDVFSTPKPERLIERVLTLGSNPDDIVLDSFLGSGTTAAVAHKMGRRYIGIELGEHCYTHCVPRLQKVIDGEQGGISKAVNWQGGGGFKFYELAPTLIVKDGYGQPVFNGQYNAQMLVAAVAKLNGYQYQPDPQVFWKQARGQDKSYLYVTTQYLSAAQLDAIEAELNDEERLMVCAAAFDQGLNRRFGNIEVRKIPQAVLDKCEYGIANYNLNIISPPELTEEDWEDA